MQMEYKNNNAEYSSSLEICMKLNKFENAFRHINHLQRRAGLARVASYFSPLQSESNTNQRTQN